MLTNIAAGGREVLQVRSPASAFLDQFNRPDLAFDVDGVLAFFVENTLTALNAKFGTAYQVTQVKNYWMEDWLPTEQGAWLAELFANPAFYSNLAPDYAAIAALQGFAAAGFHITVTSDRPAAMQGVTAAWLQRFKVPYDVLVLHGRESKKEVVSQHGPAAPLWFFDDDPRKVAWLPGPGIDLWLPLRPWTPDGLSEIANVHVFDAWDQVREALNQRSAVPVPMLDTPAVKSRGLHGRQSLPTSLTPSEVYAHFVREHQKKSAGGRIG